jgi:hypothetical protein
VTLRDMRLPRRTASRRAGWAVAGCLVLAAAGCGREQIRDESARDTAGRALQAAADLGDRVATLEAAVAEARHSLSAARTRARATAAEMRSLERRLRESLDGIRTNLETARSTVASASEDAAAALDHAAQSVRDLSVLEKRFEYHLRIYHGGG